MESIEQEARRRPPRHVALALFVAVALSGAVILGAAYWVFGRPPTPELARFAPKDTQVYVELPDVRRALLSAARVEVVEPAAVGEKNQLADVADALAASFDVRDEQAEALLRGVESVAIAGRGFDDLFDRGVQAAVIVRVRDVALLDPLLRSERVDRDEPLAGATRYVVKRREREKRSRRDNELERFFDKLHTSPASERDAVPTWRGQALAVVPEQRLLVIGDVEMVDEIGRVARGDHESLAARPTFREASYRAQGVALAYVDPASFGDEGVARDFFRDHAPWTGTAALTEAGLLSRYDFVLAGQDVRDGLHLPEPRQLTLARRLPADTVGYVAASLDFGADGKTVVRDLLLALDDLDPREATRLERDLQRLDDRWDLPPELLVDAFGGEGIAAVVASDKTDIGKLYDPEELIKNVGFVLVLEVKDKDKAERVMRRTRDLIEEEARDQYEVKRKDGGILVIPTIEHEGRHPYVWMSFEEHERWLMVVVGSKKRIGAIRDAFAGFEPTLSEDAAHARALAALPGRPQIVAWADLGRVAAAVLDRSEARSSLRELGIDLDFFRLDGPRRVTAAAGLSASQRGGALRLELADLNGVLLGAIAALADDSVSQRPRIGFDAPEPLEEVAVPKPVQVFPADASTGVPECDDYLKKLSDCADKMSDASAKKSMKDAIKTSRDGFRQAASSPAARDALVGACKQASDAFTPTLCQ